MKATCTSCEKPFTFADERFGERPSVRVRCPACKAVVTLTRPGGAPASPPAVETPPPVPAPPAPPGPSDSKAGAAQSDGPPTLKVKRKKILDGAGVGEHMPPMPTDRRVSVALLSGPDTGTVLPCSVSRAVIGRAGSDLPIKDEEISRRHAMVEIRDDRYFLKDLGSTNGTFVDERRITETEIFDKSEFRVGVTNCMLIVTPKDDL